MAEARVEKVRREVIEGKVLAALNEEDKVAIILTKEDLDLLIDVFSFERSYGLRENGMLYTVRLEKVRDMLADMRKLRKEAFGEEPVKAGG